MALLISLGTALYHTGIKLAAPFVPKARAWVDGRHGQWQRLEAKAPALQGCLWMHCASTGEFEQGRPVLEAIKRAKPDLPVLLTFFSPSGYKAHKGLSSGRPDSLVTHVEYLPPDSAANAERLQRSIRPRAAIFIKYEYWQHHLHALKVAKVPTYLVSAIFRPSQPFFKWYGGGHRAMLRCYMRLFVQDDGSRQLLDGIGVRNVTVSGDTRFDRVSAIVAKDEALPIAEAFRKADDKLVLVAGSTWPEDERTLAQVALELDIRCVVVPHELTDGHLRSVAERFAQPLKKWSDEANASKAHTLLVDRMGYLSRLYKYADITYVGGGYGSGIHNTLEAAAWGKPVIFGPNYQRFAEARGLIAAGGGFSVRSPAELGRLLQRLINDRAALEHASQAAGRFVAERTGATERVVQQVLPAL